MSASDESDNSTITMQWLVDNQYHDNFWTNVRKSYQHSYKSFRKKSNKKEVQNVYQSNLLSKNLDRMNEIYNKNILNSEQLIHTINDKKCTLITRLNIPKDVILYIITFVGDGVIPISYSLSFLPFFHAIREHKLYRETLKKWWDETRKNVSHRGEFFPKNIKTAAIEFQQFFTKRLSENGVDKIRNNRVKYHRYMIPCIAINMDKNILTECCSDLLLSDTDKNIKINLPTASGSSACIGGIELFQRLYLETAVNPQHSDTCVFNIDLIDIDGNHGDNWCFDGNGYVLMENHEYKKISELEIGENVCSFPGNKISKIKCIIVSNINKEIEMVELNNNCWITFEHPILTNVDYNNMDKYQDLASNNLDSDTICQYDLFWSLPKQMYPVQYRYQDKIYNFVLDSNHNLCVNGNWCCTLGHDYKGNVIQHDFWGNSKVIEQFLRANSRTYPYVVFG